MDTRDEAYTARLLRLQERRGSAAGEWLYRFHVRRLARGAVLDLGCGIGRNLLNLSSRTAIGVDHNASSVEVARERGLNAFTPEGFIESAYAVRGRFDSLLLSHVVEHMSSEEACALLAEYLPFLRPRGRVCVVTPQEAGHLSDPTHIRFMDFEATAALLATEGIDVEKQYSFPLPRVAGRRVLYNEFITIGRKT